MNPRPMLTVLFISRIGLESDAQVKLSYPLAPRGQITGLQDHHISPVTALSGKMSAARRVCALRAENLDKGRPHGQNDILESPEIDAGVAECPVAPNRS